MGVRVCPRCQQWYIFDGNEIDIIHECGQQSGASEVLRNEDKIVMGSWEDYTGSKIQPQQMVMMQGITNNIWGTRGAIEGGKVSSRTSRGNDIDMVRTRKHEEFIVLK